MATPLSLCQNPWRWLHTNSARSCHTRVGIPWRGNWVFGGTESKHSCACAADPFGARLSATDNAVPHDGSAGDGGAAAAAAVAHMRLHGTARRRRWHCCYPRHRTRATDSSRHQPHAHAGNAGNAARWQHSYKSSSQQQAQQCWHRHQREGP